MTKGKKLIKNPEAVLYIRDPGIYLGNWTLVIPVEDKKKKEVKK